VFFFFGVKSCKQLRIALVNKTELLNIQYHAESLAAKLPDDDDLQKHIWAIIYLAQYARIGVKPSDYDEVTRDEVTNEDD
jgi:hypothetical protein